ncbi:MAG: transcriptional regulator, TetR family [Mycobacterium sp.]|nr:transcriptional regulator, TetR family [Mycobacterium sp.]
MTLTSGARPADGVAFADTRGERTRAAILEASRRLFLDRGYAGTPINAITAACGISRAGFYTYFKDKREVFNVIGETVYHDLLDVLAEWDRFPAVCSRDDVLAWVGHYFDHMDRHGAFVVASAHSAPTDDAFRRSRDRMVTRAAWTLGQAITGRRQHSQSPEVVGAVAMALLERSWYSVQTQAVSVDRDEVMAVVAEMLFDMITAG